MPYRGQLRQLRARSDHPGRHDPRGGKGGISEKEPTKKRNYKYETREMALAATKKKKNRARKDRRRRAKQYLTAARTKTGPQDEMTTGSTKEEKRNVRQDYKKVIRRAKQQRRRRQAIKRHIWKELRTGLPKMEEKATLSTQPAKTV